MKIFDKNIYQNLIKLIMILMILTYTQGYAAQITDEINIIEKDLIESVIPLPIDKNFIEKYYTQKLKKPIFFINRLSLSPTEDKIAFSVNENSIWIVKINGSDLRCLTCDMETAYLPSWSKDGNIITFITGPGETNEWYGTFMQVTPDGAQKKIIGSFNVKEPANKLFHPWRYSPDGQYLLRPGSRHDDYNLYVVRTRDQKILMTYKTQASILNAAWFPNGQEILLEELKGHGDSKLIIFSITGKRKIILPKGRMDMNPAIHPSGQLIAYFNEYDSSLHFLTKDGSKDKRVLEIPKDYITNMIWAHKGNILIFPLNEQIYFLKLRQKSLKNLLEG